MALPTLKYTNRDALNEKRNKRVYAYIPSHVITEQFERYSYIRYNKIVVSSYARNLFKELSETVNEQSISNITDLCRKYYHAKEDGIYQLGFQIYSAIRTLKQPIVTEAILKVVVIKYLKLKKRHYKMVDSYVNKLFELGYITPIKKFEQKSVVYKFTVHAHMIFGKHYNISK